MAKVPLEPVGESRERFLDDASWDLQRARVRELNDSLFEKRAQVRAGWGEKYAARVREKGKLTTWERIERLRDPGTPVLPVGTLVNWGRTFGEEGRTSPGAGVVTAFVRGSTAAVATMEHEPGGVVDLKALLDRLIPVEGDYEHNRLNHDSNSHAHQRATLVGPSEQVPVIGGRLALGTWQQLVLIDFDDRPRDRTVVIQVTT